MHRCAALVFLLATTLSLYAQQTEPDTLLLEEVSVSLVPFQQSLSEATGGIARIDLSDRQMKQVINNEEMINRLPGVFMASGTFNTNRIVIRGIGSRNPYGSNRIKAFLDGIPLTSGDGTTTVEDIDVFSLGMIELIKGPSSALYGSGLGGVLKLNSRYPFNQGWSFGQRNQYASFNTWRNQFVLGFKKERSAFSAGYSRSSSSGFRENSEYLRNNLFLNARYFGKKTEIAANIRWIGLDAEIPSSLNENDYLESPDKAAANWLSAEGYEKYRKLLAGLTLTNHLGPDLDNELVVFTKVADPYERRPFNVLDENSLGLGMRESLYYMRERVKVRSGIEVYRGYYNWNIYERLEEGHGQLLSENREIRSYINAFSFVKLSPLEKLVVDAAINLNITRYHLENIYDQDKGDISGSHSYSPVLSPRIGLNYQYLQGSYFYFAAGHGFSAPSVEESLLPDGQLNTALQPEYGWNLELGSRGDLWKERFHYDLTLYSVYLQNLLVTERLAEDIFTGRNAGTVLNTGVELMTQLELLPGRASGEKELDLQLGFTASRNQFLDFVDEGVDHSGNILPGIPGFLANSSLNFRTRDFYARLDSKIAGKQWMDDANTLSYKGHFLANILLGWNAGLKNKKFGLEISAGIKNLFDQNYASMILVNAPSFGSALPRYYYPGMPRTLHFGLAFTRN